MSDVERADWMEIVTELRERAEAAEEQARVLGEALSELLAEADDGALITANELRAALAGSVAFEPTPGLHLTTEALPGIRAPLYHDSVASEREETRLDTTCDCGHAVTAHCFENYVKSPCSTAYCNCPEYTASPPSPETPGEAASSPDAREKRDT